MDTQRQTSRFLLIPEVRGDENGPERPSVRRYELSRLPGSAPASDRAAAFGHLRDMHD